MQKLLILGNCQAPALATILEKVVDQSGQPLFDVLKVKPVYELSGDQQPLLEELCRECDILLYQPHIKHKFTPDWRTSDYWVSITSAKHIISFPSLYFSGYNPELTYLRNDQGQHLNAGFVDYHDKRIVKLFLDGKPEEEILRSFHRIQPLAQDVVDTLNVTLDELKRREEEQALDIRISAFVEKNYLNERLFYTYNHPANPVLYEVVRQLLLQLGLCNIVVPHVNKELLKYDYFPIVPAVAKYLKLKFSDDLNHYKIQNTDLNRKELVKRYFEIYQANQDWVAKSSAFKEERWLNRKKLILHVGQSKTGTTSFQSYCYNNRDALLEQGVLYPEVGLRFTHHRKIAEYYKGEDHSEALISSLREEIVSADCNYVLISCESFEDINSVQAQNFLNDFSDFDVFVVCSVRNRLDWVQSMYSEYIKKGWFLGDFSQFISYRKTVLAPLLNWKFGLTKKENQIIRHTHKLLGDRANLEFWLDLLPVEKLIVVAAGSGSLWSIMADRFGIDFSRVDGGEKKLNASPSLYAVEMARLFYKAHNIRMVPYPVAMRFTLALDKYFGQRAGPDTFFSSEEQVFWFLKNNMADDFWLQTTFGFSRSCATSLFNQRYLDAREVKGMYTANAEQVASLFAKLTESN